MSCELIKPKLRLSIGNILQYHRQTEKKMRRSELAELVGMETETIQAVERGRHLLSTEELKKICEALEVSYEGVIQAAIYVSKPRQSNNDNEE